MFLHITHSTHEWSFRSEHFVEKQAKLVLKQMCNAFKRKYVTKEPPVTKND